MNPPPPKGSRARRAALLALGALALHQLRYLVAYGDGASEALHREGHTYLGDILPAILAIALAVILARLIGAASGRLEAGERCRRRPLAATAAIFAASLFTAFYVQELTEGLLAAGHPGGLAALLANGGWTAIPLALVIGLLVTVAERLLSVAEHELSRAAHHPPRGRRAPPVPRHRSLALSPPAAACLSFGFARRPPPLAALS